VPKGYYVDSSIWRDYFENRSDRFRPLGEWAFEFFKNLNKDEDLVVLSDFLIDELVDFGPKVIPFLKDMKIQHVIIKVSDSQLNEAESITKVHFEDAVHAVLARDNSCILVSRDRHFLETTDMVETYKPEDLF